MNKTRKFLLFLAVVPLVMMMPFGVEAFEIRKGDSLLIGKGEVINDNVYVLANEIAVNGKINGDLVCLAKALNIKGEVAGDVICATQNAHIGGTITGDLRIAVGGKAVLSGTVENNANVLAQTVSMPDLSSVRKSLLLLTDKAVINGSVGGNLEGAASQAEVAGHITGDIDLEMGGKEIKQPLSINEQAYVGGNVNYRSFNKKISISDEAYINKSVDHEFKKAKDKNKNPFGFGWFYSLVFCLLIGLLIAWIGKKRIPAATKEMTERTSSCFAWGALLFMLAPIAFILLLLTIVGIPLALIFGFLWLLTLLTAKVLTGIWLGQKILKKTDLKKDNIFLAVVVGIIMLKLIITIPYVGQLFGLAAVIWSLGALWLILKRKTKKNQKRKVKKKKK